ncbi:MAG: NAD-dependent malic enzyme [Halioglobus sp.]
MSSLPSLGQDKSPLYIPFCGPTLLERPLYNKGSGFSAEERREFNLTGLLPAIYETIEEQVDRAYKQFCSFEAPINKHIYLRNIQDRFEILYYKLVQTHLEEMLPIIYTPTVGEACVKFSDIYRGSRGLFIPYTEQNQLDDILHNAVWQDVKIIVVTDGERVLGLGDQGIGGMGISVGKLALYTVCGGIDPGQTLPVVLDVGTNNEDLLNDPMYMGLRESRVGQAVYDEFLEAFITAAQRRWPGLLIQFEDFAQPNAMPLLQRYRDRVCCFNDDIQGTATVTLGTLLAACAVQGKPLSSQTIAFVGAGSAGCGIAEQIIARMVGEGLSDEEGRGRVYMVDRHGLLVSDMPDLRDFQASLARERVGIDAWEIEGEFASLQEVVEYAQPDILIGVSGQPGLFTEKLVRTMAGYSERPIIFPLSNPSRHAEAKPADLIEWTEGRAILATGSPFEPVHYRGEVHRIPQCNNSYVFPGLGLGVLAVGSARVSDEMLARASEILAAFSPLATGAGTGLLPDLTDIARISREIAFAVGKVAMQQGHALEMSDERLRDTIEELYWTPEYRRYKRSSS